MPKSILRNNALIETETLIQNFRDRYKDLSAFALDENELLLRKAIRVINSVNSRNKPHSDLTTIELHRFLNNKCGHGRDLVQQFTKLNFATPEEAKENMDLASWFINTYFHENSKVFDRSQPMRTYIEYLLAVP